MMFIITAVYIKWEEDFGGDGGRGLGNVLWEGGVSWRQMG